MITGWPESGQTTGSPRVTWSPIDRFWLSFERGQFRHVFEEPVLGGVQEPSYVFKFEAEGYAPLVTRAVRADEVEVRFEVKLRPATATAVTVLLPDGSPAGNADIGLISPGVRIALKPGGLSRRNIGSGGNLLTADGQGRFRLPPDDAIVRVIVAHPDGFAESTPALLGIEPVIRLQLWGSIEGTCLVNGEAVAGHELMLVLGERGSMEVCADRDAYLSTPEQDG